MKAREFFELLKEGSVHSGRTSDVIKACDEDKEIKKVAITMMATVDVIRRAILWGADLLITHEPLYYHHYDDQGNYCHDEKRYCRLCRCRPPRGKQHLCVRR